MTENEARDAGSWVAIKHHIEAVWRAGYPNVTEKLFPEWFRLGLSDHVRHKLEAVLYDTIKLAIIESAQNELDALGVEPASSLKTVPTLRGLGETIG